MSLKYKLTALVVVNRRGKKIEVMFGFERIFSAVQNDLLTLALLMLLIIFLCNILT